jgi:16S rRNA (uracil1498-N3)-methyltransferase
MSAPRFMLSPEVIASSPVRLTGEDLRHLRVLRLRPGDSLRLCDGQGREWNGRLRAVLKDRAEVDLQEELRREAESPLQVTLYQGWARGDKLDWTIQKATEIGLARFVPVLTRRSEVKPQAGGGPRLERWREIARQAARQSERTRVPEIGSPLTFAQAVTEARQADLALMPFEGADPAADWKTRLSGRTGVSRVALLVGPEGGFAPEEAAQAAAAGIVSVGLGPRILRSETAGLVATALALFVWGDLGGKP